MNELGNLGGLLPLWIIGAPLLVGVVMMFITPKSSTQRQREGGAPPYRTGASVEPISGTPALAPARF